MNQYLQIKKSTTRNPETMLYTIVGTDKENSLSNRLAVRPQHVARIQELIQQGRLILAGPNPAIDSPDPGEAGFTGSVIIAEFDSLIDAQAWADDDPYIKNGVYESVEVKPFNKAFP
jgi:hypothetical protein